MSAPAHQAAFEIFFADRTLNASVGNAFDLDCASFNIKDINFNLILAHIEASPPFSYPKTAHYVFKVEELEENSLKNLMDFFKKLPVLNLSIYFKGYSNFKNISNETVELIIENLIDNDKISSLILEDSNLPELSPNLFLKIVHALNKRKSYEAYIKSSETPIQLWDTNSKKLKSALKRWNANERLQLAKLELDFQKPTFNAIKLELFELSLDEYKILFQQFINENPEILYTIWRKFGNALKLSADEQKILDKIIIPLCFKKYLDPLSGYEDCINLQEYPWEAIDFGALSNKLKEFKFKKNHPLTLILPFQTLDSPRVSALKNFLNDLLRIDSLSLDLSFKAFPEVLALGEENLQSLLALAEHISQNRQIVSVSFNHFALGKLSFSVLEKWIALISSRSYTRIDLSSNQFSNLTDEQLFCILKRLYQQTSNIRLSGNQIETRAPETLSKLFNAFSSSAEGFHFWTTQHFQAFYQTLPENRRLKYAEIFLEGEIGYGSGPSPNPNFQWLRLKESEYCLLIANCISKSVRTFEEGEVEKIILDLHLSYDSQLNLVEKLADKAPCLDVQAFNFKPEHRLALFLKHAPRHPEQEIMTQLKRFDFLPKPLQPLEFNNKPVLPALVLFQAWLPLITNNTYEESAAHSPKIIKEVLENLHKACKTLWPNSHFYEDSIQAMNNWPTSNAYNTLKLINMLKWFTYTSTLLSTYPDLSFSSLNSVLKEIRGYPDPHIRSKATLTLIQYLYQSPHGCRLYQALCQKPESSVLKSEAFLKELSNGSMPEEKIAAHLLIPAIFISQIVLAGAHEPEGDLNEFNGTPHRLAFPLKLQFFKKIADSIMTSIPPFYKDGHYTRQMIAALQILADNTSLSAITKLNLIKAVFYQPHTVKLNLKLDLIIKEGILNASDMLQDEIENVKKEFEAWHNEIQNNPEKISQLTKLKTEKSYQKTEALNSILTNLHLAVKQQAQLTYAESIVGLKGNGFEPVAAFLQSSLIAYLRLCVWEQSVFDPLESSVRQRGRSTAASSSSTFSSPSESLADRKTQRMQKPQTLLKEECKRLIKMLQSKVKALWITETLKIQQQRWLLLQSIELWPAIEKLNGMEKFDFEAINQDLRAYHFKLSKEELQHYENKFSSRPSNSAIFSYLAKIKTLPSSESRTMQALFLRIIKAILSRNSEHYFALRYNEALNPHLKTLFEGRSLLKEHWIKEKSTNFKEFIENRNIKFKPLAIEYSDFFHSKVFLHRHLPPHHYQILKEYLEAKRDSGEPKCLEIRNRLIAKIKSFGPQYSKTDEYIRETIQFNAMKLISLKTSPETKAREINLIFNIKNGLKLLSTAEGCEFKHDLDMLLNILHTDAHTQEKEPNPHWKLVNTDDYWTAFMVGTDVQGSCQRVDGDPNLNKCLLAYVIDGKNRILAIQDEAGKTIARSIFRMLWDPAAKKPVLFQEDIYPSIAPMQHKIALIEFAKHQASALGLTLVSSKNHTTIDLYPNTLESIGSLAPWEYVDALYGEHADGVYSIPASFVLYSHADTPPLLLSKAAGTLSRTSSEALEMPSSASNSVETFEKIGYGNSNSL